MLNLNRSQRIAYENPVIEGQPPLHLPENWALHREEVDGQAVTVVIMVSVASEHRRAYGTDAIWEISVSLWPTSVAEKLPHPEGSPIKVSKWTDRHREIAGKVYQANTRGLGDRGGAPAQAAAADGTYSTHLHLPMTEEERAGLPVEEK